MRPSHQALGRAGRAGLLRTLAALGHGRRRAGGSLGPRAAAAARARGGGRAVDAAAACMGTARCRIVTVAARRLTATALTVTL